MLQTLFKTKFVIQQSKKRFCDVVKMTIAGEDQNLSSVWLRDLCRCPLCFDRQQKSLKKIQNTYITLNVKIKDITKTGPENWSVIWQDGHQSDYSAKFLSKFLLKNNVNREKLLWNRDILKKYNTADIWSYKDVCESPEAIKDVIKYINRFGFCFINDAPPDKTSLTNILGKLGGSMETLFSESYDATMELTNNDEQNDLGWTSHMIPGHTDFSYYHFPSAVVGLHLLKQDGTGGALSLVDGFFVAEKFKLNEPKVFKAMLDAPIRWTYYKNKDDSSEVNLVDTILKIDQATNSYKQIKWNPTYLYPLHLEDQKKMTEIYKSLKRIFEELNLNKENSLIIEPKTDRILLFDNWRMIHSRVTGFDGTRIMHCGDASKDIINLTHKLHF